MKNVSDAVVCSLLGRGNTVIALAVVHPDFVDVGAAPALLRQTQRDLLEAFPDREVRVIVYLRHDGSFLELNADSTRVVAGIAGRPVWDTQLLAVLAVAINDNPLYGLAMKRANRFSKE